MRTALFLLFFCILFWPHALIAQDSLYQKEAVIGSSPALDMEAMAVDKEDNLYLLDRSRILKMKNGEVLLEIKINSEDYTSTNPNVEYKGILADMTVDDQQNIFLINNWKRHIEKYDKAGNLLWTKPAPKDKTTLRNYGRKLLVDSHNNLAIFDDIDASIYFYTTDGVLLKTLNLPWLDPYSQPVAAQVDFDADDNIYYVETINSTWNATLNFRVFNPSGLLLKEFRAEELKKQGLKSARHMKFDKNGNLYFHSFRSILFIVSVNGELIKKFTPVHQNYFEYASGRVYMDFDSQNNLYIGSYYNYGSYVTKYSADQQFITQYGNLQRPHEVIYDKSNNLYILDNFNFKVNKWNPSGEKILEFAGKDNNVANPLAIAVDEHAHFYMLEAGNRECIIRKYDPLGKLVDVFAINGTLNVNNIPFTFFGLAVDHLGNMHVSNYYDNSICKYDKEGKLISTINTKGKGAGQLWGPLDVTVDGAGYTYVLDMNGQRIQRFSPSGKFIQQFGSFNPDQEDEKRRGRISSDAFGNLVVSVAHNNYGYVSDFEIELYDTSGKLIGQMASETPGVAMSKDGSLIAAAHKNKDIVTIYSNKKPREYNYIEGNIYHDANVDCLPDVEEVGERNIIVKAEPGPYYSVTDATGNYRIQVGKGSYTVQPIFEEQKGKLLTQTCLSKTFPNGVTFEDYGNYTLGYDFGISKTLTPHLTVSVSSTRRRRCFESTTTVRYENSGFASAPDAKVYVKLPAEVGLLSADKAYTRLPDGTYAFAVGNLAAGQRGTITIEDLVTCGDESVRGRTVCTRAWITPSNNTPAQPTATLTITGRCDTESGMVRFVIKNTGTADMEQHEMFRKFANGRLGSQELFKLAAGDSMVLWLPTMGYTWRLEADQPEGNGDNKLASVTIEACTAANAGTTVSSGLVNLMPTDDEEAEVSEECVMITDSYDPNDKLVTPIGRTSENYTPTNTALKYKIRYQNTGTDVAYRVVVVDTLSEHLDLSTLQVGASSHAHRLEVSGKGRPVLTWTFDNIMLPDSNANEPGSHGYILFSIKPKADLTEKTAVENFADIFFDFNSPVRTNVTLNRIYDMPPVVDEAVRVRLEDVLATPTIVAFEPAAGRIGADVTVTGKRFASDASQNKVYLNGEVATVVSASATELRVLVPAGASTGALKVITPDGGVTAPETFTVYQPPVLNSFSPAEGMVGQTVTLQGQHLQPELLEAVRLGNAECEVITHSGNAITVRVPAGAKTGTFGISTRGGEAVSTSSYVVWYSPAISGLSKDTDIVGASVTVTGDNFAADRARNKVLFGQVEALVLEASPLRLVVRVPEQAESGLITVETPGGQAATPFVVIPGPRFTAMQPALGSVGTVVEISGRHFGVMELRDRIAFNGQEALVLEAFGDSYRVRVPRGATTGKVEITGYGGKAYSTADFVVEEIAPAEAVQVYPNPSSGRLTLSLLHADFDVQSVEVFDAVGRSIQTTTVDGPRPEKLEVQIRSAKPGLYTLRIKSGRGIIIKKITVL
ncbi:DUF7619 domain-containing protein [Pontibacter rugosus]|uniref:IPT/TIG domain-containing protein n=1 Tax=Pontibacter rugosus TaxID=1745966 RepID=A0ABW3SP88_9BACT